MIASAADLGYPEGMAATENPAKPTVSVVIPTFNREMLVQKAIGSALDQTFQDLEVVVVDDGSTDGTRAVVERYGGKVRYLFQENQGISGARNAGIRSAAGEFIALLDSDDTWLPEKLERQMALFQEHPEYGMVATRCSSIERDGSFREMNRPGKSGQILLDLFTKNFIRTSSTVFRKECFEKAGLFDPALKECEDYDIFLRVAALYPIGFIDEPLTVYLDNPQGVSTDGLVGRLYRLEVLERDYLKERIPRKIYRQRLAEICRHIGKHCLRRGQRKEGKAYLRKALRLDPLNWRALFLAGMNLLR